MMMIRRQHQVALCVAVAVAAATSAQAFTVNHRSATSGSRRASQTLFAATLEAPPKASTGGKVSVTIDPDKPTPLSPLTIWGDPTSNIVQVQKQLRESNDDALPTFTKTISAKDLGIAGDVDRQLQYALDNALSIKTDMATHGAVIFRDFDLMKTPTGFQQFYTAVGMNPCLDPLHTVSARPTVSLNDGKDQQQPKTSPVYEAVNKESRKNFFIGMHNEFVGTRAPRAAAFVCFKAAETGGEFLLADGRRILRDIDTDLLRDLYTKQIRYSVMELPFFDWIDTAIPSPLQSPVMSLVQGLVTFAINSKVDFNVEMIWQAKGESAYDASAKRLLQARAPPQPPVVKHPVTGQYTWFCNVHSHSSYLRKQREKT
jgi:Taurine catabolism dioxygenase TauD, TfdA family